MDGDLDTVQSSVGSAGKDEARDFIPKSNASPVCRSCRSVQMSLKHNNERDAFLVVINRRPAVLVATHHNSSPHAAELATLPSFSCL
jgi:hypothetical protein